MCPGELNFNPATGKCEDPCNVSIQGCNCTRCKPLLTPINCKWYNDNCKIDPIMCPGDLNFNPATEKCEDPCKTSIQGCRCVKCEPQLTPINCKWYSDKCKRDPIWCPGVLNFNPETGKCEDPCQVNIPGCNCKKCESELTPINCKWYSNSCTRDPIICPGDLNFNPATGRCEDPCKVDIKECGCSKCKPDLTPINCKWYSNSCVRDPIMCPGDLNFNPAIGKCEDPCKVDIKECKCSKCKPELTPINCKWYGNKCTIDPIV
jgi:hypothetical protein